MTHNFILPSYLQSKNIEASFLVLKKKVHAFIKVIAFPELLTIMLDTNIDILLD
jgi:hypothetical protein